MNYTLRSWCYAASVAVFLLMATSAAAATSPRQYVDAIAKTAVGVMQQKDAVRADEEFAARFDMPLFAERCLVDHWQGLTETQRTSFIDVFAQSLRAKLGGLIRDRLKGRTFSYTIGAPRAGDAPDIIQVPVQARVDDARIGFVYSIVATNDGYRLVDYEAAGALLSRNYRGQFNYLMRTRGFDGMLERMRAKNALIAQK